MMVCVVDDTGHLVTWLCVALLTKIITVPSKRNWETSMRDLFSHSTEKNSLLPPLFKSKPPSNLTERNFPQNELFYNVFHWLFP